MLLITSKAKNIGTNHRSNLCDINWKIKKPLKGLRLSLIRISVLFQTQAIILTFLQNSSLVVEEVFSKETASGSKITP